MRHATRWTDAVIGLGSSLGDREGALRTAVQALDACSGVEVQAVSRIWRTAPLGLARGSFLNGAVRVRTQRSARGLLALCKDIEVRLGRRPSARWADRALDLDLLLYGRRVRAGGRLALPHPGLLDRPFALLPAAEVAPAMIHPIDGRSLAEIAATCQARLIPAGVLSAPAPRFPLAASRAAQYTGPRLGRRSVRMKLFLDTANLDEVREAAGWGILDGVTTNPSLIAAEGVDAAELIYQLCELVRGPVSASVVATDAEGMIREGRLLARVHEQVVVKVPMGVPGLIATRALSDEGIDVNVTLIFSAAQALLAARAGAATVSPFVGRLDDLSVDGVGLVSEIVEIFANNAELGADVLAASVRHPLHVTAVARAGADAATVPLRVLRAMVAHPLTDRGHATVMAAWGEGRDPDLQGQLTRWLSERKR